MHIYFIMFFLFSHATMISAVYKCHGTEIDEFICQKHKEFCQTFHCGDMVIKGCGADKAKFENGNIPKDWCKNNGLGDYKPGSVSLCYTDMCNGETGKGNGENNNNDNKNVADGTSCISNNAVGIAIGAFFAMLVTKLEWII